jgi:hypothetical protein
MAPAHPYKTWSGRRRQHRRVRFETKIAIVVRDDLPTWQKLNMTAFLASGVAAGRDGIIGEPYEDCSGNVYLSTFGQPVLVFAAEPTAMRPVWQRAMDRGLGVAVFTDDLFQTGNDVDNRAVVRAVPAEKLSLAGLALHGRRNDVDKVVKGLTLHP